jgi:hypothetical protein
VPFCALAANQVAGVNQKLTGSRFILQRPDRGSQDRINAVPPEADRRKVSQSAYERRIWGTGGQSCQADVLTPKRGRFAKKGHYDG